MMTPDEIQTLRRLMEFEATRTEPPKGFPTLPDIPAGRYVDHRFHQLERDHVWRKSWLLAAHMDEIPEVGSFMQWENTGQPVVIVHAASGDINAFYNTCSHRGAPIVTERSGRKNRFTCPYHGWSWNADGSLRAVPQEDPGFPDLPRAERGLRRLPCREAHGFIWIIANPDAAEIPDIDDWLGGLTDDFNWLGLADHRIAVMDTVDIHANWKVLIEGGLEAYHFRVAHKSTIAPYFPDNLMSSDSFGAHIRAILPRISMPDLRNTPEDQWRIRRDANILYAVIPSIQLLVQQDHVMLFHFEPRAVDLTRIRMATLVPRSAPQTDEMQADWEKNQKITVTALMEDFELGAEIQSGFASRGNPSHLFGRFEGALNRFNLVIEELLAG